MLDLGVRRDLGQILGACWMLYRRHFLVFATIALAVVLPLDLITLGLIEGQLTGDFDADNIAGGGPAYSLVQTLITTPLITAGHVYAVMQLGDGEQPSAGRSLSQASGALPVLIVTVIAYSLAVLVGFIALIVPGIYLSIRLVLAPQAVVAEDLGPGEAIGRSWELVRDNWWRAFGIYIVLTLIAFLAGGVLGLPVGLVAAAADSGALLVAAQILADAAILSFTALGGTLLFFDLRARHAGAAPAPVTSQPPPPERPEAP